MTTSRTSTSTSKWLLSSAILLCLAGGVYWFVREYRAGAAASAQGGSTPSSPASVPASRPAPPTAAGTGVPQASENGSAGAPPAAPVAQPNPSASTLFAEGKALAEQNIKDSVHIRAPELETAIARLDEAIRLGYEDKPASYELLAAAYEALQETNPPADRMAMYREKERECYATLRDLVPESARWPVAYAMSFPEPDRQLELMRPVVDRHPRDYEARRILAVLLCRAGARQDGMRHLVEAARLVQQGVVVDDEWTDPRLLINEAAACGAPADMEGIKAMLKPHLRHP